MMKSSLSKHYAYAHPALSLFIHLFEILIPHLKFRLELWSTDTIRIESIDKEAAERLSPVTFMIDIGEEDNTMMHDTIQLLSPFERLKKLEQM